MKSIRLFLAGLAASATLLVAGLIPAAPAYAHHCFGHVGEGEVSIAECADAGACLDTEGANCANQGSAEDKVNSTIRLVINFFSFIVGVVAVIMVIVGGFKYITSAGESSNISSAKNTILYAVIGLVIVALAQIIVRFVLQKATQTTPEAFVNLIG